MELMELLRKSDGMELYCLFCMLCRHKELSLCHTLKLCLIRIRMRNCVSSEMHRMGRIQCGKEILVTQLRCPKQK